MVSGKLCDNMYKNSGEKWKNLTKIWSSNIPNRKKMYSTIKKHILAYATVLRTVKANYSEYFP